MTTNATELAAKVMEASGDYFRDVADMIKEFYGDDVISLPLDFDKETFIKEIARLSLIDYTNSLVEAMTSYD